MPVLGVTPLFLEFGPGYPLTLASFIGRSANAVDPNRKDKHTGRHARIHAGLVGGPGYEFHARTVKRCEHVQFSLSSLLKQILRPFWFTQGSAERIRGITNSRFEGVRRTFFYLQLARDTTGSSTPASPAAGSSPSLSSPQLVRHKRGI